MKPENQNFDTLLKSSLSIIKRMCDQKGIPARPVGAGMEHCGTTYKGAVHFEYKLNDKDTLNIKVMFDRRDIMENIDIQQYLDQFVNQAQQANVKEILKIARICFEALLSKTPADYLKYYNRMKYEGKTITLSDGTTWQQHAPGEMNEIRISAKVVGDKLKYQTYIF